MVNNRMLFDFQQSVGFFKDRNLKFKTALHIGAFECEEQPLL
jgi:hypothetical protein